MDNLTLINTNILPILWKLVDKHHCSGNATKVGNVFQVCLVFSKKYKKYFCNEDINLLRQELNQFARLH